MEKFQLNLKEGSIVDVKFGEMVHRCMVTLVKESSIRVCPVLNEWGEEYDVSYDRVVGEVYYSPIKAR